MSLTTSALALGNHMIVAAYSGDATFGGSTSATLPPSVYQGTPPATVRITLTTSPVLSVTGQPVTLTAALQGSLAVLPTGFVQFVVDGVAVGTAGVTTAAPARATWVISTLLPGIHVVTATYLGDATYAGATSTPVLQAVR